MSAVTIVDRNDPVLRQKAAEVPVGEITSPRIQRLIARMKRALAPHQDGVAIAAPQIGVPLRIFVVSSHAFSPEALLAEDKSKAKGPDLVFINPKIVKRSREKEWMTEGCLSARWFYGDVERSVKTTIRAYDEHGKRVTRGASGLLSQIFQHEADHLDGILFTDKAKRVEEIPPPKKK